jgi:hypothetical protein
MAFIVQYILIITKKQDHHGIVFIVSNMVFKISVGLFIMIYFLLHDIKEMYYYDKMIIVDVNNYLGVYPNGEYKSKGIVFNLMKAFKKQIERVYY